MSSDKIKKLKQQFREIVGANPNLPLDAVVKSVSGDVCSVEMEGLELSDVRLKTTADGKDNLLVIPKIGSRVLLLSTDGSVDNLTVIKCDSASKIIFNENGLEVEIDSETGKVKLKNNTTSLKELFDQLTDILKTLKVYTPAGPSGTALPESITKINLFETDFKTILK